MEKTCTLCKFTTHSDFSWESHIGTAHHRARQAEADKISELLQALTELSNMVDYWDESQHEGGFIFSQEDHGELMKRVARAQAIIKRLA